MDYEFQLSWKKTIIDPTKSFSKNPMTNPKKYRPLRDAFGQYATGVTVVTAINEGGEPIGLTANSFASVSLEPALVSWCVDEASTRYQEFLDAEFYTISVLTAEQKTVSNLFAERSWDDTVFDDVKWFAGTNEVPQIENVGARFHCQQENIYPGGDHKIIIGKVLDYEVDPQQPLLFFQGDYRD